MKKTIICVAPVSFTTNGLNNPLTPEEIAEDVYKCYLQGATLLHLHVRDKYGNITKDIEDYLYTLNLIKEKCDIIINIGNSDVELVQDYISKYQQLKIAAIHTGSLTLFDFAINVTREDIEKEVKTALNLNLIPEFCVFDVGMINNSKELMKKWSKKSSYYYGVYLGYPGQMPVSIKNIHFISEHMGEDENWFYGECDRKNYLTIGQAMILGAHIKIGYEDSVYDKDDVKALNNNILVKRVAELSRALGREVANISEAKKILGIK